MAEPDVSRPWISRGLAALTVFFAFGTAMAGLSCSALAFPGRALDTIWRLNPRAHEAFASIGDGAIALMAAVAIACALTTVGLWRRARWGHRMAVAMLGVNLVADAGSALARGEWSHLIGLPIAGALITFLLNAGVRRRFDAAPGAG